MFSITQKNDVSLQILYSICSNFSNNPFESIRLINDRNNFNRLIEMVIYLKNSRAIAPDHIQIFRALSFNLVGFNRFESMRPHTQYEEQQIQQAQIGYVWALLNGFYLTSMLFLHNCNHDNTCMLDLYEKRIASIKLNSDQIQYLQDIRVLLKTELSRDAESHVNCSHNHNHKHKM